MKSAGPHCAQRFVETVGSYLDGTVRQAAYRDDDVIPSVDSYIALRRETSALRPCFVFVEFAARIDLPDEVYYHPVLSSMELAANDWVSWTNVSKISITIKSTEPTCSYFPGHILIQERAGCWRGSQPDYGHYAYTQSGPADCYRPSSRHVHRLHSKVRARSTGSSVMVFRN